MIEIEPSLGGHAEAVERRLAAWAAEDVVARLWRRDPALWSADADTPEVADRLGWLGLPEASAAGLEPIEAVRAGVPFWFTDLVLLGMGGSSLAPEVIARTMPGEGLPLTLVDTTHPGALRDLDWLRPANSLFIVASKSGTTIETLSLFRHFWSRTAEIVDEPGAHFIAITDPGSPLAELGRARGFRAVFEAPPDVGGRFSALSPFGLVPAALAGADVPALLAEAVEAADACRDEADHNPGLLLGAALGELALAGRDKVTFLAGADWEAFPDWAEQLVAESTGKDGRGIVPVVAEPPRPVDEYGEDRLFVGLVLSGEAAREAEQWGEVDETPPRLDALEAAGHPVLRIQLEQPEELGALFLVWEVGVAMAGCVLGIHPFDQPDVQLAKRLARRAMAGASASEGAPEADETDDAYAPETEEIDIVWELPRFGHAPPRVHPWCRTWTTSGRACEDFLSSVDPTDYIAVQAYLAGGEEEETLLATLRTALATATGATTTLGHGPRFLHSTGQLHKGRRGQRRLPSTRGRRGRARPRAGDRLHLPPADPRPSARRPRRARTPRTPDAARARRRPGGARPATPHPARRGERLAPTHPTARDSVSRGRSPAGSPRGRGIGGDQVVATLDAEERALVAESAGVSAERPVGADDAVTRHDDRDRIAAERAAHGPRRPRTPDASGELRIRHRFSKAESGGGVEDRTLEVTQLRQINRQVEAGAAAVEILRQLPFRRVEFVGVAHHRRGPMPALQANDERLVALVLPRERDQTRTARRNAHGTEGRVEATPADRTAAIRVGTSARHPPGSRHRHSHPSSASPSMFAVVLRSVNVATRKPRHKLRRELASRTRAPYRVGPQPHGGLAA